MLRRLRIGTLEAPLRPTAAWDWTTLTGRLVELSGARAEASLSFAFQLVLDVQRRGESAAWISSPSSVFFPPDVAELGVDLGALVVVRAPRADDIAVAADWLARSGAFGLVVLDLTTRERHDLALGAQSRLLSLAQKHATALLCLTKKSPDQRSLSSLVSLRAHAVLHRRGLDRFECELRVLKDKRISGPWSHVEVRRGTPGLR